ncbi:MAG TPA: CehA/McbA family metallohydrolase [Vicinamibacterales bacterium]
MRRGPLLLALAAAALAGLWWLLPPGRRVLADPVDPRIVRGAFHVHTDRSDGTGTPEEVARAAAAAGLAFVITTDHGDGTRQPDPPRVVDGVLLVDAVEISTTGGHYIALGLAQTPYPLGGEPRDVIEDVRRLGGFGIAAHPDSPKPELAWREWQAPFDGLEWLNADSAWRDEPRRTIARTLATYLFRPPESIAALFDRPDTALARWDALGRRRRVVALAGHDAHARLGARGEPGENGRVPFTLRAPGYETAFRTFSLGVILSRPWDASAEPADAAATLLDALRAGRVFTAVDALAGPAVIELSASSREGQHLPGDRISGPARVTATIRPDVPGAELRLLRDGTVAARGAGPALELEHREGQGAAVYRAEAYLPGAPGTPPIPWLLSNPLYVDMPPERPPLPLLPPAAWSKPAPQAGWRIEQHPGSEVSLDSAVLSPESTAWTLAWRLAGGPPAGQYAAMAVPLGPGVLEGADRLQFRAWADAPMRASVQLRVPDGDGLRWRRSIHVGIGPSEYEVPFREMTPVEAPPGTPLDLARVDTILFVVDTVNTKPGAAGELRISELRIAGARDRQVRAVSSR